MLKQLIVIFTLFLFCHSHVVDLTSSNFDQQVLNSDGLWLVAFVAPCGHCQRLHPEYDKAAESLGGIVNLGRINCDDEKELAQRYGIKGFPTIKVFNVGKGNKNNVEDYQSGRDARSIVDYAMYKFNAAYDPVTKIKTIEEVQKIEKDGKPLVILFSNKNSNPSLFKSLGIEYSDKLRFLFVGDSNENLNKEFKISSLPKIVVIKPIDEEEESLQERVIEYDGRLKKIDLMSYLAKYANGNYKPKIPIPKELNNEMFTGDFCKSICIIGCSKNRKEFNTIAKKFHKDEKFKFSWVNLNKHQDFCKSFNVNGNSNGVNLIAYRSKKSKFSTLIDASNESSEKFILKILNGEMKFTVLDEIPKYDEKKDEL
eukprot:gene7968-12434_t